MTWQHDRVEELLAGYVLGGLDEEDRALAERAMSEHVTECGGCRRTLGEFRAVAGDLALAAPPTPPPDALRARLRAPAGPEPAASSLDRRAPLRWAALAGAAALFLGLSGWTLTLADRLGEAETRQSWMVDAVSSLGDPAADVVPLQGTARGTILVLFTKEGGRMYLFASGMESPRTGVYKVWLVRGDRATPGGTFVPDHGVVMERMEPVPRDLDVVMVTHEPEGGVPTPTASPIAVATLAPPGA